MINLKLEPKEIEIIIAALHKFGTNDAAVLATNIDAMVPPKTRPILPKEEEQEQP